jgi:pyroglutamyl-peptidase
LAAARSLLLSWPGVAALFVGAAVLAWSLAHGAGPAPRPRTILVTGFGPFGPYETNPAWESVRTLDGARVGGATVRVARIDVVWATAASQLEDAIRRTAPDVVLCLGVAPDPRIRVETLARNRDACPDPDAAGERREPRAIREGGADLPTRLPAGSLVAALEEGGFPVATSDDAGGYLCNHLFFRLLDRSPALPVAGFVHVPPLREPWDLERLRRAVLRLLETLAKA